MTVYALIRNTNYGDALESLWSDEFKAIRYVESNAYYFSEGYRLDSFTIDLDEIKDKN